MTIGGKAVKFPPINLAINLYFNMHGTRLVDASHYAHKHFTIGQPPLFETFFHENQLGPCININININIVKTVALSGIKNDQIQKKTIETPSDNHTRGQVICVFFSRTKKIHEYAKEILVLLFFFSLSFLYNEQLYQIYVQRRIIVD